MPRRHLAARPLASCLWYRRGLYPISYILFPVREIGNRASAAKSYIWLYPNSKWKWEIGISIYHFLFPSEPRLIRLPVSCILFPFGFHRIAGTFYFLFLLATVIRSPIPNQYKMTQPGNQPASHQPEYSKYGSIAKYGPAAKYGVHS